MLLSLSLSARRSYGQQPRSFIVNGQQVQVEKLDGEIRKMITATGVPGLSLAVINEGKVAYFNVYGEKIVQGNQLADRETIFEACSLSKSFLVFAVMQLVDRKLLDLDKPLYEYLPYPALAHDPRYKLVTGRMVLGHSSGIENYKRENNPDLLEIKSDPGKEFIYSSAGYVYLGNVVGAILKQTDASYLDKLVFTPLHLQRTFSKYEKDGNYPDNYAIGYDAYGTPVKKWKNDSVVVSGGIHTTARDYASLIAAVFDSKHLSGDRIKDIVSPVVKLDENNNALFWGAGFGLEITQQDTIIFQNGVHDGFRSWVYYSVPKKCGLAFFSNSSLGMSLLEKLNTMLVRLNIEALMDDSDFPSYPSPVLTYLKLFRENRKDDILTSMSKLSGDQDSGASYQLLDKFAWIVYPKDRNFTRAVMLKNLQLHPNKPEAYYSLGKFYLDGKDYQAALEAFIKGKSIGGANAELEELISQCKANLHN